MIDRIENELPRATEQPIDLACKRDEALAPDNHIHGRAPPRDRRMSRISVVREDPVHRRHRRLELDGGGLRRDPGGEPFSWKDPVVRVGPQLDRGRTD